MIKSKINKENHNDIKIQYTVPVHTWTLWEKPREMDVIYLFEKYGIKVEWGFFLKIFDKNNFFFTGFDLKTWVFERKKWKFHGKKEDYSCCETAETAL